MNDKKLLAVVDNGYGVDLACPSQAIDLETWELRKGVQLDEVGDGLAVFIASEFLEAEDEDEFLRMMETARNQLDDLINHFDRAITT